MIVKSINLQNYRNYKTLGLRFDPNTNIFYGDNAQGKTNILEAVYVSGTTKSHKGAKDKELIYFSEDEAHICTIVEKNGMDYKIDMHLRKNKTKGIAINGLPIRKASELFGIIHFVFFSPEDLSIIKNGPAERRRFLDVELCQLDKVYLHQLSNYNKLVLQRNKILKEIHNRSDYQDVLDILDIQLVQYGTQIVKRRKQFVSELNEIISKIHSQLSGETEHMVLTYESDITEKEFSDILRKHREKDLRQKTTTVGPHRDDLSFLVNEVDIRKFGSQGQQRTAALSLKLSEIELVKKTIHDTPILLLDDVLSELDSHRQNYLLNSIQNIQTMITCTGLDEFINHRFSINRVYKVVDGKVTVENEQEANG
ncbi:MAG: DNA replication/repair protein RecF [Lachnospiraceae bacterium]|nr:DNA replication/repair protein RecF [Lachnospiraceae bacterium]